MNKKTQDRETFLDISVCLTGYDRIDLIATGMTDTYFECMSKMEPVNAPLFLAESRKIMDRFGNDDRKLEDAIAEFLMPANYYNGLAGNVITMWYLGTWVNEVISPESYVAGLVWPNASTHPYGAKQPGYGSWAEPPIQHLDTESDERPRI